MRGESGPVALRSQVLPLPWVFRAGARPLLKQGGGFRGPQGQLQWRLQVTHKAVGAVTGGWRGGCRWLGGKGGKGLCDPWATPPPQPPLKQRSGWGLNGPGTLISRYLTPKHSGNRTRHPVPPVVRKPLHCVHVGVPLSLSVHFFWKGA